MATLHKLVDADQWDAEEIIGRLGLIAHAAFLHAGSYPTAPNQRLASGHLLKTACDTTSTFRSRLYTAPALVHREGAEAAVLMLCKAEGGDFALLMFLTTDRDMRRGFRQRLDAAAMVLLLSHRLDDTAPWVSQLCMWLANGACWDLFVELCRRNGLALTSFMSLPDDIIMEILKRIVWRRKALAAAACTCRLLRRLVAECKDTELWKPLFRDYYAQKYMIENSEWFALRQLLRKYRELIYGSSSHLVLSPVRSTESAARGKTGEACRRKVPLHDYYDRKRPTAAWWTQSPQRMVRGACDDDGRSCKVPRGDDISRKQHRRAGAIHSPSCRYRWKHR